MRCQRNWCVNGRGPWISGHYWTNSSILHIRGCLLWLADIPRKFPAPGIVGTRGPPIKCGPVISPISIKVLADEGTFKRRGPTVYNGSWDMCITLNGTSWLTPLEWRQTANQWWSRASTSFEEEQIGGPALASNRMTQCIRSPLSDNKPPALLCRVTCENRYIILVVYKMPHDPHQIVHFSLKGYSWCAKGLI